MDTEERGRILEEMRGKKLAALYLTDWQMRMVKDFLGVDCHVWCVASDAPMHTRYGIEPGSGRCKKMYLTDWQRRELRAELNFTCEFVELEEQVFPKYMVDPDQIRGLVENQPEGAFFRVELDENQVAQIKELFGLDCRVIDVPIDDSDLVKYKIPPDIRGGSSLSGLVLNRAQQRSLYDKFGAKCDFLLIDRGSWVMYRVPVERPG